MFVPTLRRNAPGFWKKTNQEFARAAKFAINLEGLSVPTTPYPLLDFSDPETITWQKTLSDKTVGGYSTVSLSQIPYDPSTIPATPAHALFHGHISTKLPANRPDIQRTGYAAFRNQERGRTLWGELFWNVDPYDYLALRVKSDGRKYMVNLQTDSIVETDIHQHRLYTKHHRGANGPNDAGEWETVLIKLHQFVRTNHGTVVEPQSEMLRQRVRSVGIGLTDRTPGNYSLAIGAIWATNLNERGAIDGRMRWEEADQGSARLDEVTEEKIAERIEARRKLPREKKSMMEQMPKAWGNVGTGSGHDRSGNSEDSAAFR